MESMLKIMAKARARPQMLYGPPPLHTTLQQDRAEARRLCKLDREYRKEREEIMERNRMEIEAQLSRRLSISRSRIHPDVVRKLRKEVKEKQKKLEKVLQKRRIEEQNGARTRRAAERQCKKDNEEEKKNK